MASCRAMRIAIARQSVPHKTANLRLNLDPALRHVGLRCQLVELRKERR
jgi:hypothetical protein